jgi:hypothetical protein
MTEPDVTATDKQLADYYDRHRDAGDWADPGPVHRPERLDVTISVRFTASEIAAIRAQAAEAGVKPTAYIRNCALDADQPPIDRGWLSETVAALTHDLDDLRRAAGRSGPCEA